MFWIFYLIHCRLSGLNDAGGFGPRFSRVGPTKEQPYVMEKSTKLGHRKGSEIACNHKCLGMGRFMHRWCAVLANVCGGCEFGKGRSVWRLVYLSIPLLFSYTTPCTTPCTHAPPMHHAMHQPMHGPASLSTNNQIRPHQKKPYQDYMILLLFL